MIKQERIFWIVVNIIEYFICVTGTMLALLDQDFLMSMAYLGMSLLFCHSFVTDIINIYEERQGQQFLDRYRREE